MAESNRTFDGASRRKFMLVTGTGAVAGLAGCGGQSGGSGGESGGSSGGSGGTATRTESDDSSSSGMDTSVLTADGSSTVFPITNTASSYWNSNPEAGDDDYWPQSWAQEEYGTDRHLADFFAQDYGDEATGTRSVPPFRVSIALSHSGTGVEGVMEGRVALRGSVRPDE